MRLSFKSFPQSFHLTFSNSIFSTCSLSSDAYQSIYTLTFSNSNIRFFPGFRTSLYDSSMTFAASILSGVSAILVGLVYSTYDMCSVQADPSVISNNLNKGGQEKD